MYLVKHLALAKDLKSVLIARPGIEVLYNKPDPQSLENYTLFGMNIGFWGDIHVRTYDRSLKETLKQEGKAKVTYANSYKIKDMGDGNKDIILTVSLFNPKQIQGYIIFVEMVPGQIKTNGQRIAGRYQHEAVVVLEKGQYLEIIEDFGEVKRVEMVGDELVLSIITKVKF